MKKLIVCIGIFWCQQLLLGQEHCYLGIGGKDDETIIAYFDLDEFQKSKLKDLGVELTLRNGPFLVRLDKLLERHKESSPEVLMQMSYRYKAYLDSLDNNMRIVDKKLLTTFNSQQYNLYVALCNYAQRAPISTERPLNE